MSRQLTPGSPRPLVSVIIPTHNRAALLREALESVFAQEGAGEQFTMEVIVIDDASSDATPEVAARYAGVRYVRLPTNRGLPTARNAGIKVGTGTYLAFLDDDDLWLPGKLRVQVPALDAHPEIGVAYSQCIARFGNHEYLTPEARHAPSGMVVGALLKQTFGTPVHSYLVRREAVERVGCFDESLPCLEDYDLWLRLALHHLFLFIPGPVGVYRLSPRGMNVTEHASGRTEQTLRRVLERLLTLLPDTTPLEVKHEIQSCVEFQVASRLILDRQVDLGRPHLEAALRSLPRSADDAHIRHPIARIVGLLAVESPAPLPTTRTLCREMQRAARSLGLDRWAPMRRLLADVWTEVAISLASTSFARDRAAGYAAARAVLHDPAILGARKVLLRLVARGIMGRQIDPLLDHLRRPGGPAA